MFGYIDMELYELANQLAPLYPSPLYFNGNDAVSLLKNQEIVDIIGRIGEDPGERGLMMLQLDLPMPMVVIGGQKTTLIRKPHITNGGC